LHPGWKPKVGDAAQADYNGPMPIYEYQASTVSTCAYCENGFERLRKLSDPPIECCPQCGAPVQRKISAPNLGQSGPSLEPGNIEKHGFTQYRKAGDGVYEKTAGKGPSTINKDEL
jgi:putative FmdB family regulatory protein